MLEVNRNLLNNGYLNKAFDSNVPRFGNGVYFSVNSLFQNVRLNNMINLIYTRGFHVIRFWFTDEVNCECDEIDYMIPYDIEYNDISRYNSVILEDYMKFLRPHLDPNVLDGKDWKAECYVRRLTAKEVELLKSEGHDLFILTEEIDVDLKITPVNLPSDNRFIVEKPDIRELRKHRAYKVPRGKR